MSDMALGTSLVGWLFGGARDNAPSRTAVRAVEPEATAAIVQQKDTSSRDAALITRIRDSDPEAFRTLMDAYLDDIVGVAYTYVRTADVARDIAQDVFVRLWDRRHLLDPSMQTAHYLRRAARNAALNMVKQEGRHRRLEQEASEELLSQPTDGEQVSLQGLDHEEFMAVVRQVLDRLSPRVREVAMLHYERGYAPGEIAMMLEVAPRTVYNQLRTATHALADGFRAWGRNADSPRRSHFTPR